MWIKKKNDEEAVIRISRGELFKLIDNLYELQACVYNRGDYTWANELGEYVDNIYIEYLSLFGGGG